VSILAELIAVRRGVDIAPLSMKRLNVLARRR
jgi:xanthine/CO dehydrogenase XdhC/CoxF family maturation factor